MRYAVRHGTAHSEYESTSQERPTVIDHAREAGHEPSRQPLPRRDVDRGRGPSPAVARNPRAHDVSAALVGPRDSDPLRSLHDEHAGALRSYVLGLTGGDRGKAQDVVQETLLRAWRNLAGPEQIGGSGRRGWLFTVAKRIAIDDWRAAYRRPAVVTDQVPEQSVEDAAQQTVDRQLVLSALRTLSTKHRQVLFECYFRDASVAEAADTLGVPAGTVKSRTHYALLALRRAIDDMGGVA
jgi:RNA polymerase sigma-70 factor (ECF subfamily)